MTPKIKNIIIFTVIAVVIILVYFFFIKKEPNQANLVSSSDPTMPTPEGSIPNDNDLIAADFLSMLLNVKNINLDDSIFSDPAFLSLRDSSILLIPDGNEGRPNPFAPIGVENVAPSSTVQTTGVGAPSLPTQTIPKQP